MAEAEKTIATLMTGRRQQTIPGTEPKIPLNVLRQAHKVLELKDAAELAKARLEAATEYLHAAMAREKVARFVIDEPDMPTPLVIEIDMADPRLKITGYKKPDLSEIDLGEAAG